MTLIFSPRNMASMFDSQAGFFRQLEKQLERLVGDAVLRVVEKQADGFDRQPFTAFGIIRE